MFSTNTKTNEIITPSTWLFAAYFILVIFRLWLTGDRDIVATNSPYDEYWYIDSASRYIWGGGYTHMAFAQIPTYSLWLLGLSLIGIPARFGIDALWIFSSLYLAIAITRFTRWKSAGLIAFVLLALHPYAIMVLDRGLAETLLAALSVLTLAAGIELWNSRHEPDSYSHRISYGLYVAGFTFAYLTRKEGVVLLAPLAILLLISFLDKPAWWSGRTFKKLAMKFIIVPLATTIIAGSTIAACNYTRLHMFVLNELSAPGYQSAIKALNSIDVGRTPRHATVTAKARSLAYEVSPTFRELAPFFEGPLGQSIAAHPIAGVDGEIGNGWFYWALRDAGANAGWFSSARSADKKYAQISLEINKAFADSVLKKRPYVISNFVDPDLGKWVAEVPNSTWNIFQLLAFPRYQFEPPVQTATSRQFEQYVAIDGRRRLSQTYEIAGWVAAPPGSLMALSSNEIPEKWSPIGSSRRTDIPTEAYPFRLTESTGNAPKFIYLHNTNGDISRAAISGASTGDSLILRGNVNYAIGIDEAPKHETSRLDKAFGKTEVEGNNNYWLYILYTGSGYILTFLIISGVILALATHQKSALLLILISASGVAARCLILGILDASSWPGTQVRYVFPALPFLVCAGVIGFVVTARSMRVIASRWRA